MIDLELLLTTRCLHRQACEWRQDSQFDAIESLLVDLFLIVASDGGLLYVHTGLVSHYFVCKIRGNHIDENALEALEYSRRILDYELELRHPRASHNLSRSNLQDLDTLQSILEISLP